MERFLVSIIIPAYNEEKTIAGCLKSVLCQTYQNIEVILVDDGSSDATQKIAESFTADLRFRYFRKENGGVSSARNAGLERANGEYIQFVDGDDSVAPDMTERLVSLMREQNGDLVVCGFRSSDGSFQRKLPDQLLQGEEEIQNRFPGLFEAQYMNSPCNKLYRRELCRGLSFPEEVSSGEDLIFNLLYLKRCARATVSGEILYICYRSGKNRLTTRFYENCLTDVKALSRAVSEYLRPEIYRENAGSIQEILWKNYIHCIETLVLCDEKTPEEKERLLEEWQRDDFVRETFSGERFLEDRWILTAGLSKLKRYFNRRKRTMAAKLFLKKALGLTGKRRKT